MSLYEFLLFVHIGAAAIWVGGSFFLQIWGTVVSRTNDAVRIASFAHDAGHLGERVFIPATIVILLAGIGLMIEGSWDWGQLWVVFGLAAFAASFLVGLLVIAPLSKKIAVTVEAEGPASPAAQAMIRRIFQISRVELVVLYAVVFAMAVKPTTDDGWTVVIGAAVVVALSVLFLARRWRPPETTATPVAE